MKLMLLSLRWIQKEDKNRVNFKVSSQRSLFSAILRRFRLDRIELKNTVNLFGHEDMGITHRDYSDHRSQHTARQNALDPKQIIVVNIASQKKAFVYVSLQESNWFYKSTVKNKHVVRRCVPFVVYARKYSNRFELPKLNGFTLNRYYLFNFVDYFCGLFLDSIFDIVMNQKYKMNKSEMFLICIFYEFTFHSNNYC